MQRVAANVGQSLAAWGSLASKISPTSLAGGRGAVGLAHLSTRSPIFDDGSHASLGASPTPSIRGMHSSSVPAETDVVEALEKLGVFPPSAAKLKMILKEIECDSEIRTTAPVPLDGPVGEKTSILSVLLAQAGTREQEQFLARVQAGYLAALHHRRLIRDLTPHGTALTADNVSQLGVLLFPFKNALISAHCQAYPSLYATAGTLPPQAEGHAPVHPAAESVACVPEAELTAAVEACQELKTSSGLDWSTATVVVGYQRGAPTMTTVGIVTRSEGSQRRVSVRFRKGAVVEGNGVECGEYSMSEKAFYNLPLYMRRDGSWTPFGEALTLPNYGYEKNIPDEFFVALQNHPVHALQQLFAERSGESGLLHVLVDGPGFGKTSSIRVAAERAGAGYCRLVVGFGVLGTLEGWLAKAEEQLQDVDSDKNIMAAFTKECKRAMTSLLSKLTAEITQRVSEKEANPAWIGDIQGNGIKPVEGDVDSARASALESFTAALASVGCVNFVVHVDEAQAWAAEEQWSRPPLGSRHLASVQRDQFPLYRLVALSWAMADLAIGSPIQFALTGTSCFIQWDSNIKVCSAFRLPYFSREQVEQVLQMALKPDAFAALPPHLFATLAGSPRVLQYFLADIAAKGLQASLAAGDDATLARSGTYERFHSNVRRNLTWATTSRDDFLAVSATFLFPALVRGARLSDDGTALELPVSALPPKWRTTSLAGVPRVQYNGNFAEVFRPYPFLEAFLRAKRGHFSFNVLDSLLSMVPKNLVDSNWYKGHLFERAVVLELSCPASPLWKVLAAEFSRKGVSVFSPSKLATRVAMGPVFDEAAQAAVLAGDAVFMVKEDQKASGGRAVGGAVACRIGDSPLEDRRPSAVCFSVKNVSDQTKLRTEFLKFFKAAAKSKSGNDLLWVAVSYEAYTGTKTQTKKTTREAEELAKLLDENHNFAVLCGKEMFRDNCLLPIHEFAEPGAGSRENVVAYFLQLKDWDKLLSDESNNSLRNRLNTFIPYDSESDSDSSKTVTE